MNTYKDFRDKPDAGYGFIYFLRSPSGKGYVGQTTTSIRRRVGFHTKKGKCRALYGAIEKYGIDNFFVGEVGCYPIHELDAAEIRFIKEFETLAPNGYNLTTGGQGKHSCSLESKHRMSVAQLGKHPSVETRQRMSTAFKLRPPFSAEHRSKLSKANKNPSAAIRKNMSDATKGKPKSAEHRRKLSEAKKGKPLSAEHRRNIAEATKTPSIETRRKMSEWQRNRPPPSTETRQKISVGNKGKKRSLELRQKISESLTGKKQSEETKLKRAESLQRYHASIRTLLCDT